MTLSTEQKQDKMRTVRFRPYRKGAGPTFTLNLYYQGHERIGYEFRMRTAGASTLLFSGDDFRPSPLHSVDGDEAVEALMSFLTLRKGDTDAEYFTNYTQEQLDFSEEHAETLSADVMFRFSKESK